MLVVVVWNSHGNNNALETNATSKGLSQFGRHGKLQSRELGFAEKLTGIYIGINILLWLVLNLCCGVHTSFGATLLSRRDL